MLQKAVPMLKIQAVMVASEPVVLSSPPKSNEKVP